MAFTVKKGSAAYNSAADASTEADGYEYAGNADPSKERLVKGEMGYDAMLDPDGLGHPNPLYNPGAAPSSAPSMAGLQSAAGISGGDGSGGGDSVMGGVSLSGPSKFRQGIGQRIPPVESQALAALRKIY